MQNKSGFKGNPKPERGDLGFGIEAKKFAHELDIHLQRSLLKWLMDFTTFFLPLKEEKSH
ncbi:hypothetical protein OXIME_001498 [Oxyplasma meridianum]|uniref:Uncharacterized protein n=1 Tax=Oxyplasma meridianum TaxID=3073602 RepID=A0AAX4NJC1_9ARCH